METAKKVMEQYGFDENGDGTIDKEEFRKLMLAMGKDLGEDADILCTRLQEAIRTEIDDKSIIPPLGSQI